MTRVYCFFFHYNLATSTTNWAQIFTGLLFYAYVEIHQVGCLWQLPIVSTVLKTEHLFIIYILKSSQKNISEKATKFKRKLPFPDCKGGLNSLIIIKLPQGLGEQIWLAKKQNKYFIPQTPIFCSLSPLAFNSPFSIWCVNSLVRNERNSCKQSSYMFSINNTKADPCHLIGVLSVTW